MAGNTSRVSHRILCSEALCLYVEQYITMPPFTESCHR
jgi:hypothetical protein